MLKEITTVNIIKALKYLCDRITSDGYHPGNVLNPKTLDQRIEEERAELRKIMEG